MNFSPRQQRVLDALLAAPKGISREAADRVAGASNSPDVIMRIRAKLGPDSIDMHLVESTDRDGKTARPGVYSLTDIGRKRLRQIGGTA